MSQKRRTVPYQYEPPITPASWHGDELRFAIRLSQIFDDLYQKYSALRDENVSLRKRVKELEDANA